MEIQRALYSSKDHGIRASDLEHYFQQHGFRTFTFAGKWDDLKQHLAKGRPLIVALKPSALETQLHYVVVVGVDQEQGVVLLNDAAQRKLLKQEQAALKINGARLADGRCWRCQSDWAPRPLEAGNLHTTFLRSAAFGYSVLLFAELRAKRSHD